MLDFLVFCVPKQKARNWEESEGQRTDWEKGRKQGQKREEKERERERPGRKRPKSTGTRCTNTSKRERDSQTERQTGRQKLGRKDQTERKTERTKVGQTERKDNGKQTRAREKVFTNVFPVTPWVQRTSLDNVTLLQELPRINTSLEIPIPCRWQTQVPHEYFRWLSSERSRWWREELPPTNSQDNLNFSEPASPWEGRECALRTRHLSLTETFAPVSIRHRMIAPQHATPMTANLFGLPLHCPLAANDLANTATHLRRDRTEPLQIPPVQIYLLRGQRCLPVFRSVRCPQPNNPSPKAAQAFTPVTWTCFSFPTTAVPLQISKLHKNKACVSFLRFFLLHEQAEGDFIQYLARPMW